MDMESGIIAAWQVAEGDFVQPGRHPVRDGNEQGDDGSRSRRAPAHPRSGARSPASRSGGHAGGLDRCGIRRAPSRSPRASAVRPLRFHPRKFRPACRGACRRRTGQRRRKHRRARNALRAPNCACARRRARRDRRHRTARTDRCRRCRSAFRQAGAPSPPRPTRRQDRLVPFSPVRRIVAQRLSRERAHGAAFLSERAYRDDGAPRSAARGTRRQSAPRPASSRR